MNNGRWSGNYLFWKDPQIDGTEGLFAVGVVKDPTSPPSPQKKKKGNLLVFLLLGAVCIEQFITISVNLILKPKEQQFLFS